MTDQTLPFRRLFALGGGLPDTVRLASVAAPIGKARRLWRRLSQPHYAIILVAALAIGLLAVDRLGELQRARDAAERDAAALASNLAMALARDFQGDLSAIDRTLETLAMNLPTEPGYRIPGDVPVNQRLRRRLGALTSDLRGLYVLDESGRFIHNTESPALLGADRSDRDYFRGARESEGMFIGVPIRSRTDNQLVLSLTRRIEGRDGQFIGAVSASLPLGRLEQFYARFNLHPSVAISLWHTDGMLLARRPPVSDLVGKPMPARPIQEAINGGSRSGVAKAASPVDGNIRIAAFEVLQHYPFAVTVAMQEEHYLADWRESRDRVIRDFVVFAVGLLGLATALAVLFRRRNVERLAAERDLREVLEKLDASNHAKTMFLATMSHELRTPLNAILGFSEIIRDQKLGPVDSGRYSEYAEHIHGSGKHLLDVINDILDMTKIETGKWKLCFETLDLGREIHQAVVTVQPLAEEGGLAISEEIGAGVPALCADRRALRQVLLNLLTNAIKFTPRGGSIAVMADVAAGAVTISVKDNGVGMSPADLERIGRPFVRLGNPLTAQAGGTGLGLAISKSLVELHGGRMTIESTVGAGTTVRLVLPIDGN